MKIIEELIVILDKFLDVLNEFFLILCDRNLCRRPYRRCFLKGVSDAVDLQLIVLQIRIRTSIDLDTRIRARCLKLGRRARNRK